MTETPIDDLNVLEEKPLVTPAALKSLFPLSESAEQTIIESRQTIRSILSRRDPRLLVVVGPCSIHDTEAALDYAKRLKKLASQVEQSLYLVMRVYFEKPRTTVGWKGLINDPRLDDSFRIEEGLQVGRSLLVSLAEMGIPTATEALDPVSPQYLQDLISWSAIGARTAESQTHREMASGLSSAVGSKMARMAALMSLSTHSNPFRLRTVSSVSIRKALYRLSRLGVIATPMSCFAGEATDPTTRRTACVTANLSLRLQGSIQAS